MLRIPSTFLKRRSTAPMASQSIVVICTPAAATSITQPLVAAGYAPCVQHSIAAWCAAGAAHAPCVIIDVGADGATAPDTHAWECLRARGASTVFLYGGNEVRFAVQAMRAGAVDVLTWPVDPVALLAAARHALAAAASTHGDTRRGDEARQLLARCTPREREIVARVTRGQRNKHIAHDLDCRESTVKVHRSRAMRKLGLRSLADLIRVVELAGSPVPVETPRPAAPVSPLRHPRLPSPSHSWDTHELSTAWRHAVTQHP